jgi:hypothetical protein
MSKRRIRTALLALTLALPMPVPQAGGLAALGATGAVAAGVLLAPGTAEAQRRSGGYSRPSSGGYSRPSAPRTPSFSPPRAPSAPSSGGYSRPSPGYSRPASPPSAPLGGGDRSVSRRSSGEALDRYRESQRPPAPAPAPAPSPGGGTGGGWGGGWGSGWGTGGYGWGGERRRGGWGAAYPDRGGYWAGRGGWTAPGWAYRSRPSFGAWDALFLWFLLDNLSRPGYGDWFHHHRDDPGYAQWRAEAERMAQGDAELRRRLDELDRRLAEQEGQPRDPSYLPPGTPAEAARAEPGAAPAQAPTQAPAQVPAPGGAVLRPAPGEGSWLGGSVGILLLAGGGLVLLVVLGGRFRRNALSKGGGGTGGTMGRLGTAADILRRKATGERYEPSLFRVGMTITLDPTPFILAGTATRVTPPGGSGGDALVGVEAVGALKGGGTTLHRLYLDGGRGFFQLHLDASAAPEECRWFSVVDEINPADQEEWRFWLDPAEGMVGWPQFQAKDGKLYDRQWSPGSSRVEPVSFEETVTDHRGSRARRVSAMLYAAPTGAAAPAPQTEYMLVAVIEEPSGQSGWQAWVEVAAGIDVNPATLSLA